MIEAFGNIWDHIDEYDAVVITTNGSVKKNGEAVMGRGIALEAKNRFPTLAADLGKRLAEYGTMIMLFEYPEIDLFTFPVKYEWQQKADINLIKKSADGLALGATWFKYDKIVLPRPGCGNGGLSWEEVKPVIEPYLDDRFTVMERL